MEEAPTHTHNEERGVFVTVDGVTQAGPAPRFSRTEPSFPTAPPPPGSDTDVVLGELGVDPERIAALRNDSAIF